MTFTPGQTGHTAEHNRIRDDLDGRLSDESLAETFVSHEGVDGAFATVIADPTSASKVALDAAFVAVRTSDGHPLPPSTIVVITLDKTLAEVTASPVADIADITFEEA